MYEFYLLSHANPDRSTPDILSTHSAAFPEGRPTHFNSFPAQRTVLQSRQVHTLLRLWYFQLYTTALHSYINLPGSPFAGLKQFASEGLHFGVYSCVKLYASTAQGSADGSHWSKSKLIY